MAPDQGWIIIQIHTTRNDDGRKYLAQLYGNFVHYQGRK